MTGRYGKFGTLTSTLALLVGIAASVLGCDDNTREDPVDESFVRSEPLPERLVLPLRRVAVEHAGGSSTAGPTNQEVLPSRSQGSTTASE